MRNAWIWIVVLVIILVGGYIWWQSSQSVQPESPAPSVDTIITPPAPADTTTGTNTSTSTSSTGTTAGPVTITYDGKSFSPASVTVKKGNTVKWVDTSGQMWVASAPHPAHTGYDGTSRSTHCAPGYTGAMPFDECVLGSSYSFTFDKVGTWPYHDHMNPSAFGSVVVTE
jgi:plastocyanin